MAAPLVQRFTGDVIPADDHNDVKIYIEDGLYRVNTKSLNIGGIEVISETRVLQNVTGNISLFTNDVDYLTENTPIINSEAVPTTETDGSALTPFVSRWINTTTNVLYYYISQGSNNFWIEL